MDNMELKKKHKKKRRHSDLEEPNETVESVNETLHKSHKKKKKKHKCPETQDDNTYINKSIDKDTLSSENSAENIDVNCCESMLGDKVKKEKKKKKHDDRKEELSLDTLEEKSEESQKAHKKAKKKKKKHSKEDAEVTDGERSNVEISSSKVDNNINDVTDFDKCVKKKKKKSKKHERNSMEAKDIKSSLDHIEQNEYSEPSNSKKAKIDNKHDINDVMENGSQYNEPKVNREDIQTGQWSSAELGDSDRQNKFMRLLGGFKKGGNSSQIQKKFGLGLQNKGNLLKRPGGNCAMNKQQQDIYTKNLESDYERAMSMNLNRGVGLGFEKPPDEGKKFYINTKASNSIKFDD